MQPPSPERSALEPAVVPDSASDSTSIAGSEAKQPETPVLSRRAFLGTSLGATAAFTSAAVVLPAIAGTSTARADPGGGTPTPQERKDQAFKIRVDAAYKNFVLPIVPHPVNGDEVLYPNFIGSYSKGLPHNQFGEVQPQAYLAFLHAAAQRTLAAFDSLPPGEPDPTRRRKYVNPLGGVAFDMEGIDSHEFSTRAPPAFASPEEAGEIVENYWMALLRDIPFARYATDLTALAAVDDLNALSDFRGPRINGQVTPKTLFREDLPGALVGPWVSQFFWMPQPFGAQAIEPRIRTAAPNQDFMTDAGIWLAIQNGSVATETLFHDNVRRYIRNGRDIGEWVHVDVLYQAYFQAGLQLLTPPDPNDPFTGGGLGVPPNPGNPYLASLLQEGFGTFGGPYFMTILTEVATRALKAVWYQKWFVHRRLRPEAFAGRVHHRIVNNRNYPIDSDVFDSKAIELVVEQHSTYFLPMAFPEGSPLHPAYGAGHGTVAGACVTILKALFDTQLPFRDFAKPVIATNDGLNVVDYISPDVAAMTVEGELNKLAYNVALGRNIAGVHWRSDGIESLRLGEEVAISVLRDQRGTYCEPFAGFTFRRFDGTTITI